MINPCGENLLAPSSFSPFPVTAASFTHFSESPTELWEKVKKATYEQWVALARSRRTANQLELFVSKPNISITLGGEEYIWKDGQLYKAVRSLDQSQIPVAPWVRPQPVQPVMPGDQMWIGDGLYRITWCSNNAELHKNANQENGYVIWQ